MEETISLKEIFEVLKKRLLMIIAFIVAAALIAGVVSYFVLTPTYQSSSQFIVNQGKQDAGEQYDVNRMRSDVEMINTYNVILKSPAILDDVVDALGLPYSSGALSDKLQVASEQDSQVVTVTATDEDPATAVELANTTVEIFQEKISDIMNVENVSVLSEAELSPNPSPVAPNPMLNIAIAVVLGAMVGVGIAFLLEYLDNTITSEDDIEKKLGLPVLGVIVHIKEDDVRGGQQATQAQPSRMKRGGYNGA
jgi:capsular polysaccharide biosynthesis protein